MILCGLTSCFAIVMLQLKKLQIRNVAWETGIESIDVFHQQASVDLYLLSMNQPSYSHNQLHSSFHSTGVKLVDV
jgi:hypothetical protein